jgi:hypothetical protein
MAKSEAWQRKEGKNEKGGLNEKDASLMKRQILAQTLSPLSRKSRLLNLRNLLLVVTLFVLVWRV